MDNFDGQVLPGARSSTSNADTTGAVTSGVSRAVTTSATPQYPTATVVDVGGARYRATLLEGGVTTEYLLWAASSGPLAVAPGTLTTNGTVSIPTGTLTAGSHTDGTHRVVITDNGGSDIATVSSLTFLQGGTSTPVVYTTADFTFDSVSSTVTFNTLVVSAGRGDRFTATAYTLDGARFNWTRNDPTGTRFGWNGAHRKWEPYKGGPVKSLGKLSSGATTKYVLSPVPAVAIGQFLPGSATPTKFSMVRLGSSPGEGSYPVTYRTSGDAFSGVLVVSDDQANATYNFATSPLPLAGVMGATKGTIVWNPAFVLAHAGETVWYSPRDFESTSKGVVGSVLDTLYIAPVPAPTERPLLRIGNRKLLAVISVATETLLSALTVPGGSVGVALSTGKIKLNAADVALADPSNVAFDPLFLGATLHYDGGALNRYPQPVQSPVLIGVGGGTLIIPPAVLLPGTGVSGIVEVPDGTGNTPNPTLTVNPRPVASGLVKSLGTLGDAYLYTASGRVAKLVAVNWDSDLPTDIFSMPFDTAYVSLDTGKVVVGYALAQALAGRNVYFSQSVLTPALYPDGARVFSRIRDVYTFAGETFSVSVDGTPYTVTLASGIYTTDQVVTLLTPLIPAAIVGNLNGYLYIGSNLTGGTVSVGFREEGCRALGFPPGWYVTNPAGGNHSATDPNWLPDSGVAFGLSRSPSNLDGSQGYPDVRATYRVTDATLSEDLASVPYTILTYPPREDIAGYDTGVFFALSGTSSPTNTQVQATLQPWTDVVYQFDQSRFGWLSPFTFAGQVLSPVSSIDLGQSGVIPETFYTRMGGYLRVSKDGGSVSSLTLGTDFLVPSGSGTALLIDRVGPKVQTGYRGGMTGGTGVLTDTSVVNTATPGDRLKVTSGPCQGSYTVVSHTANTIAVTPNFPATSTGVTWELYRGVTPGTINPAVVGDAVYNDFNHLPSEPFEVRILTSLGTAGPTPTLSKVDLPTANSGRTLAVRFAQNGTNYPLTVLTSTVLGVIANGVLSVPTANPRFSTGSFSVVVGTRVFTNGVDLVPVSVFTNNPTIIEYNTTTGLLNFGSSILASYQSASVVFRQEVLPYANVPTHTGELSPFTGVVSLNAGDLSSHTGDTVYLVDLQTHEEVYLNPILGAFTFRRPMESGQLVEATYYRAVPDSGDLFLDSDGQPVIVKEFLPVFVRREVPTRISQQLFSFNPSHKTLDTDVAPSVWVGASLVSYGTPPGVVVSPTNNTFSLVTPVPDLSTKVLITYAVFEANGGETSYTVSHGPVWRPPFRISAGSATFVLDTNRTVEMVAGKILRLDNYVTYIRGSTYNSTTQLTTVTVFPAPTRGVGTLSPSEPPTNLLTDRPITPVVDPAGGAVHTTADTGFLPKLTDAYGLSAVPVFQTVTPGQSSVRFNGDLTRYAVAGHIIEMFGIPYLIAKSDLVDGTYTDITLGSPSPIVMAWTSGMDTGMVRISVRPVYPSGATTFVGVEAYVSSEPYEVVLFQGTAPGVTLAEGSDYNLDPTSGTLTLTQPRQKGLMAGSSLRFYRTVQKALAPFVYQGVVQYPRVSASASAIDPPSATNGRLHAILQATYTFDSPDSFYARSVPLSVYIAETSNSIVRGVTQNSVGTNPSVGGYAKSSPSTQGSANLPSQRQDLVSRDRVTRTFLRYYNGVVSSFEQVLENLTGNPVGDRDGKLRLWMGTGDPWTPPGYEDGITGALNPRNIWSDVWNSYRTSPVALIPSDPVTNPVTATLDGNGNPVGTAMDSATLGTLSAQQRTLIKNDVDDVVLTGLRDTQVSLTGFIHFQVTQYGIYQGLSSPSVFSRIFPELTYGFTTTNPGIGYDPQTGINGVYSFGKLSVDLGAGSVSYQSTSGQPIAQLSNPVRGNLTSVLGAVVSDRRARARVISYSPTGYQGTTTHPAFLATVLTLDQFPVLSDGAPDFSKLYSNSGTLFDLGTGDPTLHTPPFRPGDQVSLGTPDGRVYGLGYTGTTVTVGGDPVFTGVFVDAVLQGCIVTLKSYNSGGGWVSITDPNTLVLLTTPNTGTPLTAELGDTLFVVPTTGAVLSGASDPPTTAQLGTYAKALPGYRMGTDVNLDGRTGSLVDATLPSWSDPFIFGIKEITGQKPPQPLTNLQAQVTFQNGDTAPSNIPALRGQPRLDSGDYSLPYYGVTPTELTVLGEVLPTGIGVVTQDSVNPVVDNPPAPGYPPYAVEAVYPDEVLSNDGEVSSDPSNPASLISTAILNPTYTPHSGVGLVQPFDLLFIQDDTVSTLPGGSRGIHTVGAVNYVSPSVIEPPRFISPCNLGHRMSLAIENVQAHEDVTFATGMRVAEDATVPGSIVTTFTLTGTSDVVFDDGLGGGALTPPVGGFNTFFTASDKHPFIVLKVLRTSGTFATGANTVLRLTTHNPSILLCGFEVSGDNGTTFPANGTAHFTDKVLTITTDVPFFDFGPYGGGTHPSPGVTTIGPLGFAVDLDADASFAYTIPNDRLSVLGPVDTRSARPRGTLTSGGDPVECRLTTRGGRTLVFNSFTASFVEVDSTLNEVGEINGGVPFTFLPRDYVPSTYQVGAFFLGIGFLKVMPFEGWGNTPITSTDITFSVAPSSRQDETGAICTAIMVTDRVDNTAGYAPVWGDNRFMVVPGGETKGSVSKVLPGDIAVIQASNMDPFTPYPTLNGKVGTHLVRGVVVPTTSIEEHRDTYVTPDTNGDYNGWLPFVFPTVTSVDPGGASFTVSEIQPLPPVTTWAGSLVTENYVFPLAGTVFVIVSETGLQSTNAGTFSASIVSADYATLDPVTGEFSGLSNYQNGLGGAITAGQFASSVAVGAKVSGMVILPVDPHGPGVPSNFPGYTSITGTVSIFGFRTLSLTRNYSAGSTLLSWAADPGGFLLAVAPTLSKTMVYQKVKQASSTFLPPDAPVYKEIPGAITTPSADVLADWDILNTPSGAAFTPLGARCLLPGTVCTVGYSGAAGIYVEPSFPTTANDLGSGLVNVVDAGNSLTPSTVGVRRLADYVSTVPLLGQYFAEFSEVEIRRIRRFHDLSNTFAAQLLPLRYCYEIRRGITASATVSGGYTLFTATAVDASVPPAALTGGTATQLGDFTNPSVNIHPGDEVRFLSTNGTVTARAEVVKVTGARTLTLSKRLTVSPGTRFEVYLKVPPVPHEQSNEELLGYATDKVVVSRVADYATQKGGSVPTTVNVLEDTDVDFTLLNVAKDDIVLVDPAGPLAGPTGPATPLQRGRRPFGDNGVIVRPGSYTAGAPARADDNRGYYKVDSVSAHALTVSAMGGLAGGTDVILGDSPNQYVVYPTIHASTLPAGAHEGQMDLRRTHLAVGNSFTTTPYSVAPFSYRVIRPTKLLTSQTVELILSMRERMLSWMEEIRSVSFKYGTYYVFQRDRHVSDLGFITDPESGRGLLTNAYLHGIVGRWDIAPFVNTSDCLSILDRRFWGLDFRLDTLTPPSGVTPYADFAHNNGRPVLVDRVNDALDGRDKLRVTRFSWLSLRTDRVKGTLAAIRRFDVELPKQQAEAEQALAAVQSVEKV